MPAKFKRASRTIPTPRQDNSLATYLATYQVFGGTDLERIVDGAAAQMGLRFDDAQVTIQLAMGGWTRIDRVNWNPLTAVYIDGIQHRLRPEVATRDYAERSELAGRGWRVFVLDFQKLLADPRGVVGQVWFGAPNWQGG